MKVLSRDFTKKEKFLLLILGIIMVGLSYYRFVDMEVRDSIAKSKTEAENLQMEFTTLQTRVSFLQNLQKQLDTMKESGELSYMPSYNNSKEEVDFLNDILADTIRYSVSFANVSRNGDQIRRSFALQYTTQNYKEAEEVIQKLGEYKNRCLVGDLRCAITEGGEVTFSVSATFFETMAGGIPDAGLPADTAAVNK